MAFGQLRHSGRPYLRSKYGRNRGAKKLEVGASRSQRRMATTSHFLGAEPRSRARPGGGAVLIPGESWSQGRLSTGISTGATPRLPTPLRGRASSFRFSIRRRPSLRGSERARANLGRWMPARVAVPGTGKPEAAGGAPRSVKRTAGARHAMQSVKASPARSFAKQNDPGRATPDHLHRRCRRG